MAWEEHCNIESAEKNTTPSIICTSYWPQMHTLMVMGVVRKVWVILVPHKLLCGLVERGGPLRCGKQLTLVGKCIKFLRSSLSKSLDNMIENFGMQINIMGAYHHVLRHYTLYLIFHFYTYRGTHCDFPYGL